MEIRLAQLEQEVADEAAFEDTFDLECDETGEHAIPELLVDDDAATQPYVIGRAPSRELTGS